MYRLEFCDDPNNPKLFDGEIEYEDSFEQEFMKHMGVLDKYEGLTIMYRIVESCRQDLYYAFDNEERDWWEVNKAWLNYLNAIYSCKEFIGNYEPSIMEVHDKYYKKMGWYRFICDYRNIVIHSSELIVVCSDESKEFLVGYDKVQEVFRRIKSAKNTKEELKEIKRFIIEELNTEIYTYNLKGAIKEEKYISVRKLADKVSKEINEMKEEIALEAYKLDVPNSLQWFIDKIPYIDDMYWYPFIVNYEKYDNNENEGVLEPSFTMEQFVHRVHAGIGEKSKVSKEIGLFLKQHKYNKFFDGYIINI